MFITRGQGFTTDWKFLSEGRGRYCHGSPEQRVCRPILRSKAGV